MDYLFPASFKSLQIAFLRHWHDLKLYKYNNPLGEKRLGFGEGQVDNCRQPSPRSYCNMNICAPAWCVCAGMWE